MMASEPTTTPEETTTPIADRWVGIVATTRRAFLRYVQRDNGCEATGGACRRFEQCGCWLEMENAIHADQ